MRPFLIVSLIGGLRSSCPLQVNIDDASVEDSEGIHLGLKISVVDAPRGLVRSISLFHWPTMIE